jgi:hypothetical protein
MLKSAGRIPGRAGADLCSGLLPVVVWTVEALAGRSSEPPGSLLWGHLQRASSPAPNWKRHRKHVAVSHVPGDRGIRSRLHHTTTRRLRNLTIMEFSKEKDMRQPDLSECRESSIVAMAIPGGACANRKPRPQSFRIKSRLRKATTSSFNRHSPRPFPWPPSFCGTNTLGGKLSPPDTASHRSASYRPPFRWTCNCDASADSNRRASSTTPQETDGPMIQGGRRL